MEDWKIEFYKNYSTLFENSITADTYKLFVPYGKYLIRRCFPADKNANILDMGCGIGGFVKVFIDEGYRNAIGVDVSEEDVNFAHQYGVPQVMKGELFETIRAFGNEEFDVVLYLDVLEHFDQKEVLEILRESFRILRHGGTLILHVPNAEGIFGSRIRYSDFTHQLAFTSKSLSQIVTYGGFKGSVSFEDKPLPYNLKGIIRHWLWEITTLPIRFLHLIETGSFRVELSQNILFKTFKP